MGNAIQSGNVSPRRLGKSAPSNRLTRGPISSQYPKNLNYPFDSELYLVHDKKDQKTHSLKRVTFHSESSVKVFLKVLDHLITFKNENLVNIQKYFVEKNSINDTINSYSVNIVMDHIEHTLRDELILRQREYIPYSELQLRKFLADMVDALNFLKNKNLGHGSICPANIYVTADNKYKLCFIGETMIDTDTGINPNTLMFMEYMAPQLRSNFAAVFMNGEISEDVPSDKYKCDIFSLGLVFLQMASLKDVCNLNIPKAEGQRIRRVQGCNKRIPNQVKTMVESFLYENETRRPDYSTVKSVIDAIKVEQPDPEPLATLVKTRVQTESVIHLPKKQSKKFNHTIEMKVIEDHSGDKVCFNYPFDMSMMSEDYVEEGEGHEVDRYLENRDSSKDDFEFETNQEEFKASKFSKSVQSMDLLRKSIKFERQSAKKNKGRLGQKIQSFTEEAVLEKAREQGERNVKERSQAQQEEGSEVMITQEEDLFKTVSSNLKVLGIKLGGQPKNKSLARALGDFISKQEQIEELVLTLPNMCLGDQEVITVVESMIKLNQLRVLYLELKKDKVNNGSIQALGKMLKEKKSLVQLGIDLAGNSFTTEMCKHLAIAFQSLDNVKSLALNIGCNQIKSEGLKEIGKLLGGLSNLETLVLFLHSNEIEEAEAIKVFIKGVKGLGKLKSLMVDLSDNLIDDEGAEEIFGFLKSSSHMQINIEAINNCMSEDMIEKIEKELALDSNIDLKI